MSANKVKFGLENVHYAQRTVLGGVVSYGVPVRIPGAVNLVLNPKGEKVELHADNKLYFNTTTNQGYEGSIEFALLSDQFRKDVFGYIEDDNGVLFEDANALTKDIALLFEFSGDVNATRHVLYNVSTSRTSIESNTKNKTIDVKTETLNITASPDPTTGFVKGKATADNPVYLTWYNGVYVFVPVV